MDPTLALLRKGQLAGTKRLDLSAGLTEFPPEIFDLADSLEILNLSGNRLTELPDEMSACVNLELVRLSANRFRTLPAWLLELPNLSWLAIAGNPMAAEPRVAAAAIDWADLALEEKLGEGASGIIHRASHGPDGKKVAVKVFKGAMTSDGLPDSERAACLSTGGHPHLIPVLGELANHPAASPGLVMDLVGPEFTPLAGPPSLESCSRDVYPPGIRLTPPLVLGIARGIASAAAALHAKGIMHGDLYGHNILWNAAGHALLGDFGAATFYPPHEPAYERLEVLAFGRLLEELLERCDGGAVEAAALAARCVSARPADRPCFAEIVTTMAAMEPS